MIDHRKHLIIIIIIFVCFTCLIANHSALAYPFPSPLPAGIFSPFLRIGWPNSLGINAINGFGILPFNFSLWIPGQLGAIRLAFFPTGTPLGFNMVRPDGFGVNRQGGFTTGTPLGFNMVRPDSFGVNRQGGFTTGWPNGPGIDAVNGFGINMPLGLGAGLFRGFTVDLPNVFEGFNPLRRSTGGFPWPGVFSWLGSTGFQKYPEIIIPSGSRPDYPGYYPETSSDKHLDINGYWSEGQDSSACGSLACNSLAQDSLACDSLACDSLDMDTLFYVSKQLVEKETQFPPTGSIVQLPPFQNQPLKVPTFRNPLTGEGNILIDNFEYWDSPYSHGWKQIEPLYPVYGFGLGYATVFTTVSDLQEGSRVLDVYRPSSALLLGTGYEKHEIIYHLSTPSVPGSNPEFDYIDLVDYPVISFKFRAPLGLEPWDIFEFEVVALSNKGYEMLIRIKPVQPPPWSSRDVGGSTANMGDYLASIIDADLPYGPMVIEVDIGQNYLDGTWHVVWLDLKEVVEKAFHNYEDQFGNIKKSDWEMVKANQIKVSGQKFRLDDIIFREKDFERIDQPDLFEPGPLYAQLFEPYRYLFISDYEAQGKILMLSDLLLEPENFVTDPDKIRDIWVTDLLRLDPDYHALDQTHIDYDPNYTDRWIPGQPYYGTKDPVAEKYLGNGFFIDSTLPVFADPNLRLGGKRSPELQNHGTLGWNVTIGDHRGAQTKMIKPLPINPYDGMPTYIPSYYRTMEVIKTFGKAHYGPDQSFTLESALWNTGVRLWPNIAYIDYEPQVFENLIITIKITNGMRSDIRTIPITVVNYPVENYPPVAQLHVSNKVFYIGEKNEYFIRFLDPDCFMFSLAQFKGSPPAGSHLPGLPGNEIRKDQDNLTFQMTLNDLPSYQYGPWTERIIDPHTGLISFTPQFQGAFEAAVYCIDNLGAYAFGKFTIYGTDRYGGTWLNHPPLGIGAPTRPIVIKAGESVLITAPDLKIEDIDGDELYASCNIGSVGRTADGGFLWTFQTNTPGTYDVEITFYDRRGGYLLRRYKVMVEPWWYY